MARRISGTYAKWFSLAAIVLLSVLVLSACQGNSPSEGVRALIKANTEEDRTAEREASLQSYQPQVPTVGISARVDSLEREISSLREDLRSLIDAVRILQGASP